MATAVFLGAGYSLAAGMPLAKDLFSAPAHVVRPSAERRWRLVVERYQEWKRDNPGSGGEEFLTYLSTVGFGSDTQLLEPALELLSATFAATAHDVIAGRVRYSSLVTRGYRCDEHTQFWDVVLAGNVSGIVTTNYDTLTERSLRHRPYPRLNRPGFHYGGIPLPQQMIGFENPFLTRRTPVTLMGGIPVYKLHGSSNWALEDGALCMYVDVRPSLRRCSRHPEFAIIPPVAEKAPPDWLVPVWKDAEECLGKANQWIVCGYSLPPYDTAIREMLVRASSGSEKKVVVLDPDPLVSDRYRRLVPELDVVQYRGLPEGIWEMVKGDKRYS